MMDLYTFRLSKGAHDSADKGVCAMEAVAWMAGEQHSDRPQCACPVLGAFTMRINDCMEDEFRPLLNPLILKLIGTRSTAHQMPRAMHFVRSGITRILPIAFDLAAQINPKFAELSAKLKALPANASYADCKKTVKWARDEAQKIYNASASASAYDAYAYASADAYAYASADAYAYAYAYASADAYAYASAASAYADAYADAKKIKPLIWQETVKILTEAIELGPYNKDEFYDMPVLRQRLDEYKTRILERAA